MVRALENRSSTTEKAGSRSFLIAKNYTTLLVYRYEICIAKVEKTHVATQRICEVRELRTSP